MTYINEYQETSTRLAEDSTHRETMWTRLRIIYGRVDAIQTRIDAALLVDDKFRRRRNMRSMPLPNRFPNPQMMNQASITAWTTWIRTETNQIMMTVEEEIQRTGDPDDPFDGTAGGIFAPPPAQQATTYPVAEELTLPPPTHTPKQQANKQSTTPTTEGIEHSIQPLQTQVRSREDDTRQLVDPAQASANEGIEHSIHSQDTKDTIKQMHLQQRRKKQENTAQTRTPTQQQNLITFTPTPTRDQSETGIPITLNEETKARQGVIQPIPQQDPLPQRVPGRREVQLEVAHTPHTEEEGEHEVNQTVNQTQPEVSHIPHTEEEIQREAHLTQTEQSQQQDTSYMQFPRTWEYTQGKNRLCWRCGEAGHNKGVCKNHVYCKICQNYSHATQACFRYENFVRNNPVASSRVTSPVNNYERNMQGQQIQKPQQAMGRQNVAHFPRFQPPVVPKKLPKMQHLTQRGNNNKQDIRYDLQFNGATTLQEATRQKTNIKQQQYMKQPIDINEAHVEGDRKKQERQSWEEQISQLQKEEAMRKIREKKNNSARILQGHRNQRKKTTNMKIEQQRPR